VRNTGGTSVPAYTFSGVYRKQDNYLTGLGRLLMGWSMTMLALAGIAFVCKADEVFSCEVTLSWAVYGFLGQALLYAPLHAFSKYYQRSRTSAQTLIVGTASWRWAWRRRSVWWKTCHW
jgi:putative colanic acid biosynthesis UDP-glucose lipid carrier transferase